MIKLTHLGQTHELPFGFNPTSQYLEKMSESQIKIANYIKSHPNGLVFLEGLTENCNDCSDKINQNLAQMIFPNGLPNDVSKLSLIQKEFIYDYGGSVRVMNLLGELKTIYRTITPEESSEVDFKISDGDWSYMIMPREKAAIECVKEIVKKTFNVLDAVDVIIVYGALHDFTQHCLDNGFEYKKINCNPSTNKIEEVSKNPGIDTSAESKSNKVDNISSSWADFQAPKKKNF